MEENKKDNDSKPVEKNIAQENVPYATSVLVLGICSIVTCFCYGFPVSPQGQGSLLVDLPRGV